MVEGDRAKRRLAAIVAADVAGFSRLVGADEEGTLARLKALRRELIDPRITEHSGRIVKTTGDGLLLEFGSAVDAIRCVVDIQRAMTARESGLASLPEGSETGLRRLVRGEVTIAAIHLHRLDGDDEEANPAAVADAPGLHDAVVIAFARREQGIVIAPGNPLGLGGIASLADRQPRVAQRPAGAGAQLLLLALLAQAGLSPDALNLVRPVCATGTDLAQAIRTVRADCGIATRGSATSAGLDFQPLTWERFDLVLRQRDYFLPGPQALFAYLRSPALAERAAELGGYDVGVAGAVRLVN